MYLLLILLTGWSPLSFSQSTSTFELPDLEVYEEKVTDEEELLESVHTLEKVELSKIQSENVDHIGDHLQKMVGVNVSGGPLPQNKKTYIRGLGDYRVVQKVDGARRYEQTQSTLSSSIGLESESLKEILVHKGGESTSNAHGALGGAILYKTLDPDDFLKKKKRYFRARVGHSSASNATNYSLTGAAKVDKRTKVLGQIVHRDIEQAKSGGETEERTDLKYDRDSYLLKVQNKSSIGEIKAKASHTREYSRDSYYRSNLPSTTTNYKDTMSEGTIHHSFKSERIKFLDLTSNFYANERKSVKETHTPYRGFESTLGNTDDITTQHGGRISNKAMINFNSGYYYEINGGVELATVKLKEKVKDSDGFYGRSRGEDTSLFLTQKLGLASDKLIFDLSARASEYQRQSDKLAVIVKDKRGTTFSNVMGVTISPTPYTSIFGKISNNNRAPEARELYFGGGASFPCHFPRKSCSNNPNENLDEEKMYGREVGILLKNKHSKINLYSRFSYFYDNVNNYIETMPLMYKLVNGEKVSAGPSDATHRDYTTQNLNRIMRQGLEVSIGAKAYDIDFTARYSSMNIDCEACPSMYDAQTVGEPLYTAPGDKLSIDLRYMIPFLKTELGYNGQFVNEQKRMSERYLRAGYGSPGYSVHNLTAVWSPSFKKVGLFQVDLGIDNVTNKKYKVHNSSSGEFELGQSYKVGLSKFF